MEQDEKTQVVWTDMIYEGVNIISCVQQDLKQLRTAFSLVGNSEVADRLSEITDSLKIATDRILAAKRIRMSDDFAETNANMDLLAKVMLTAFTAIPDTPKT